MSKLFKPMLAAEAELDKLRFPLLASPKLDGVRAVVRDGVVYSRSNKPIPNVHVQAKFKHLEHFDGELIVGSPVSPSVYRDTVSVVMSDNKEAHDVSFYAFDHIANTYAPYYLRNPAAGRQPKGAVVLHRQVKVGDVAALTAYEEECLELGYEGLILRDPEAPYKMGRSTVKEGYLLKLKRFLDDEAVVVGFEERMHNGNEATINELGHTKRSSHQAGKSGRGDLGALVVEWRDAVFNIGTGFTDAERAELWAKRDTLCGQLVKFKYFPVGVKEAPRHPVFLGWRDRVDL